MVISVYVTDFLLQHCVSCCLDPRTLARRQRSILAETVNPILLAAASETPFEFCRALCRTSSDSLAPNAANQYRAEQRFCFGRAPDARAAPASATVLAQADARARRDDKLARGVGLPDDWLKQWLFASAGTLPAASWPLVLGMPLLLVLLGQLRRLLSYG